jgi:hypothetical protein
MAQKPSVTWQDLVTGALDDIAAACRRNMTLAEHAKQQTDDNSRRMNDLLPPGLKRSPAQMAHVLSCPVKERHICGPACGYPPS